MFRKNALLYNLRLSQGLGRLSLSVDDDCAIIILKIIIACIPTDPSLVSYNHRYYRGSPYSITYKLVAVVVRKAGGSLDNIHL